MSFRILIIAVALLAPGRLAAQQGGNVNDCTLISDPIELRNCILRYGGERTAPPPTIESPKPQPPQADQGGEPTVDEVPEVPAPRRSRPSPASKRKDRKAIAAPAPTPPAMPSLPKPNPNDTVVHIEQIQMRGPRK